MTPHCTAMFLLLKAVGKTERKKRRGEARWCFKKDTPPKTLHDLSVADRTPKIEVLPVHTTTQPALSPQSDDDSSPSESSACDATNKK
jgi:hypothetical protein